ncbi:small RNA 2'-O-methyltransferase-like [Lingula anatina]|uniref:Small RNA 2'-O-methyltransferase n=1 Tax=Lingula anatina TaxID=7574 RepID=A0A1S3J5T4_LINAN|nr:small RNA 2'-O-methyltransferase-like [Lingula anatina]|eukprot:XP_013405199.1 small RNA 2'-O-methyltransferase-like [Lingula anatina]
MSKIDILISEETGVLVEDDINNENLSANPSEAGDGEKRAEGSLFDPPLYRQRYLAVAEILRNRDIKKVLDIGCAECKFLRHLKNSVPSLESIAGLDIDRALLEQNRYIMKPCLRDYVHKRPTPLKTSLFCGSIGAYDSRLLEFEAMILIEVIEHLESDTLERSTEVIFNQVKPALVVMTTPNAEFNVLFPDFSGMRHWDHKFEWTRQEFNSWCLNLARLHGYTVEFGGVGEPPEGTDVGFCSQLAIFERLAHSKPGAHDIEDIQCYSIIAEHVFPYKQPEGSIEEQILAAATKRIQELAYSNVLYQRQHGDDADEYILGDRGPVTVQVPLDAVARFTDVKHLCGGDMGILRDVLEGADVSLNATETAVTHTLNLEDYFCYSDTESSVSSHSDSCIEDNIGVGNSNTVDNQCSSNPTWDSQYQQNQCNWEEDWDADTASATVAAQEDSKGAYTKWKDGEWGLLETWDDDDDDDGDGLNENCSGVTSRYTTTCKKNDWYESTEDQGVNLNSTEGIQGNKIPGNNFFNCSRELIEVTDDDENWYCAVDQVQTAPAYRLFSKKNSPDGLAHLVECCWPGCDSQGAIDRKIEAVRWGSDIGSLCDACKLVLTSSVSTHTGNFFNTPASQIKDDI